MLALQRSAGNAAVNALLAGRMRSPGEPAVADIDAAPREVRQGEPVVDTVEKGLRAAKAAGVPVDLEGTKPPASALAVTKTGFGPESVPAKKPVPPPKPVPAVSPLGKAAAATGRPTVRAGPTAAGGTRPTATPAGGGPGPAAPTASAAPPTSASAVSALAPPVPPPGVGPAADPSFRPRRMIAKDKPISGSIYIAPNKEICPACRAAVFEFIGTFRGQVDVVLM